MEEQRLKEERLIGVSLTADTMTKYLEGKISIIKEQSKGTYLDTSIAYCNGKIDGYVEVLSFLKLLVEEAKKD